MFDWGAHAKVSMIATHLGDPLFDLSEPPQGLPVGGLEYLRDVHALIVGLAQQVEAQQDRLTGLDRQLAQTAERVAYLEGDRLVLLDQLARDASMRRLLAGQVTDLESMVALLHARTWPMRLRRWWAWLRALGRA